MQQIMIKAVEDWIKNNSHEIAKRFGKLMILNEYMSKESLPIENYIGRITRFDPVFLHNRFFAHFPNNAKLIFVNSMSDPAFYLDDWIKRINLAISKNPDINFQILTKFPQKLKRLCDTFPYNVWLGLTVTSHQELNEKIRPFLDITAGKHFLSIEPIINYVDLSANIPRMANDKYNNPIIHFIDWVIIGCMTGPKKVHVDPGLIRNIINYAKGQGKPVFVKQIEINGKIVKKDLPEMFNYREFPSVTSTPLSHRR